MTDWLVGTLLATSVLAQFVLLAREPVRARFGSRVTYGLWLIPSARLLMPTLTSTAERVVPAQPIAGFSGAPLEVTTAAAPQPSLVDSLGGLPTILLAAWIAVAGGLFLSRMVAFHRDRRAILASSEEIGREGRVRIIRTLELRSPVALGIFRPLIAVPADFENRYSAAERRLVIEHELAHHRSGDLIANLFAFVLLCLQWFNPLAWVAHAAFRFDQEAACDARVLDKVSAGDRSDYCRAIAKAASGRALLFASALDRHHSLHRRLRSMLRNPKPASGIAGKALIVTGIAVALPLTASRAVTYVDVPAPVRPVHAAARVLPKPAAAAVESAPLGAAVQSVAAPRAVAHQPSQVRFEGDLTISGDFISIDGQRKRWEELTPEQKARVRAAVAKARTQLANVHIDRDRIMHSLAAIPDKAQMEKIQRDLAQAHANVADSMRKLEQQRDELRRVGFDPSIIGAQVGRAMETIQGLNMQEIQSSVAAIDRAKIAQSVDGAQRSMDAARAELDRLQARMDADRH